VSEELVDPNAEHADSEPAVEADAAAILPPGATHEPVSQPAVEAVPGPEAGSLEDELQDAAAAVAAAAAAEGRSPVVTRPPSFEAPRRYTARFAIAYVSLAAVFVAAAAGLIVLVIQPGVHKAAPWSAWKPPSGSTAAMETAIANHVAAQYHLTKNGTQLVGVVAEAPTVTSGTHKVTISEVAVRKTPNSNTNIAFYATTGTWTDEFCGLGPSCSISTGKATSLRGRLVRREALEVALYTFKFAPAISSLVTFMPPPPGEAASTLLYFQKSNLTHQLSEPLDKTLPLTTPPLPSASDVTEAATIDKLTLPVVYTYSLAQLQDGSAALVLDPLPASS
jgi:hypothetical protein